jgi:hypothetical protein
MASAMLGTRGVTGCCRPPSGWRSRRSKADTGICRTPAMLQKGPSSEAAMSADGHGSHCLLRGKTNGVGSGCSPRRGCVPAWLGSGCAHTPWGLSFRRLTRWTCPWECHTRTLTLGTLAISIGNSHYIDDVNSIISFANSCIFRKGLLLNGSYEPNRGEFVG